MTTAQAEAPVMTDEVKAEIVKAREAGSTLAELRKLFPDFTSEQIRDALPAGNAREAKARAKAEKPAKAPKPEPNPNELTAPQAAKEIGTDPKTFRRWLRKSGRAVGQGSRYSFPKSELPKLRREFKAWEKAEAARKAAAAEAKDADDES
jgi:hypothetical protein